MIGHKSLDELLNYSWISGSLWCIFVWYWPVMARPSFLLHHIRQPSLIDWQWWWWKSMGHRWETATKTPSTRCDFCRTTLMFVNIHGNRSMLEHSTTLVNKGRRCWTDVHTIFVGQHVSTKSTNVVQQKSHRVNGALSENILHLSWKPNVCYIHLMYHFLYDTCILMYRYVSLKYDTCIYIVSHCIIYM